MPTLATFPFRARDAAVGGGVIVTNFNGVGATKAVESTLSMRDFSDRIIGARAAKKLALPWFKMAIFGKVATKKGSLRHDANLLALTGVELDYDGEAISFEAAEKMLWDSKLIGLIYTTPSHTPAAPRWRLLLSTSAPVEPAWHATLVMRACKVFGNIFAPESKTLSQGYLYGAVGNGAAPSVTFVDAAGVFVDQRDDLGWAQAVEAESNEELEASIDDVAVWMQWIPNGKVDDPLEWVDWNNIGMALFAATGGSDEGSALWNEWSKRSSKYDARETRKRWEHYKRSPPSRIGAGTLWYWFNIFYNEKSYDPAGVELAEVIE